MTQQTYYYEFIHGTCYLLDQGNVREFRTLDQAKLWVDDPCASFIEVTPDNYQELYDSGVFFS